MFSTLNDIIVKRPFSVLLLSFYVITIYAGQQEPVKITSPDSLTQRSYAELERNFREAKPDSAKAERYVRAYLKKSKAEKDTLKQARAYEFLSQLSILSDKEKYADSIISLTKTIKNRSYPARGYLMKAVVLQILGKYKASFDQLSKAHEYAIENNNTSQQLYIDYQIGLLKNDLGEHEEALIIFRSYLQKAEQRYEEDKKNYTGLYTRALFALGDAYNRNEKYDSATIINKKGLEIALKDNSGIQPVYFTMSIGITAYLEKKYTIALDSLKKTVKTLMRGEDPGNLMVCYLYMGKTYTDQGRAEIAVPYFKKIDSIAEKTLDVFPELREGYEILINYYEKKADLKNELNYIKRLMAVDSLLDSNYKYLSKTIDQEYDTPQLMLKKEKLIESLNKDKLLFRAGVISLLIIVVVISSIAYGYYQRQRSIRAELEALIRKIALEENEEPVAADTEGLSKSPKISEEAVKKILDGLKRFVEEKQFLNSSISSSNGLANLIGTNNKHLARVIHINEQKNFNTYINDLRIDHALKRLRNDTIFRQYKIKAIAKESGYDTAQTFSTNFRKRIGLLPHEYIQKIETNGNSKN